VGPRQQSKGIAVAGYPRFAESAAVAVLTVAWMLTEVPAALAASPGGSTGGVLPVEPDWRQDPALVQARLEGRVHLGSDGQVLVEPAGTKGATALSYASSAQLDWT
jgi:hypothetical protein